jgi:hypothetical protein
MSKSLFQVRIVLPIGSTVFYSVPAASRYAAIEFAYYQFACYQVQPNRSFYRASRLFI